MILDFKLNAKADAEAEAKSLIFETHTIYLLGLNCPD